MLRSEDSVWELVPSLRCVSLEVSLRLLSLVASTLPTEPSRHFTHGAISTARSASLMCLSLTHFHFLQLLHCWTWPQQTKKSWSAILNPQVPGFYSLWDFFFLFNQGVLAPSGAVSPFSWGGNRGRQRFICIACSLTEWAKTTWLWGKSSLPYIHFCFCDGGRTFCSVFRINHYKKRIIKFNACKESFVAGVIFHPVFDVCDKDMELSQI